MTPSSHALPQSARRRQRLQKLPVFALYGEAPTAALRWLHMEPIQARSQPDNWEIDAHVHHGLHQLIGLHQGQVEAQLDTARSVCAGPAVVLIPPGTAHAFRFSPDADGHVLTLDASLLTEADAPLIGPALQTLFASPALLALPAAWPEVALQRQLWQALHAQVHAEHGSAGPVPVWLARSIVWQLASLRQRLQTDPGLLPLTGRHALYTRWLVLVETHYRDHWAVSQYAHTLGLSTERLNRLVRTESGLNAQQFVHDRLVREACRWLVHVQAPVSQLAFELGFDDPAYFGRFFKRHTGLTPGHYRARAVQQQTAPTP